MGRNLFDKVWDRHAVAALPTGHTQLCIGLHLIHEVTSPQAFAAIRSMGLSVPHPERTVATVDHIIPTDSRQRPFVDELAEQMMVALSDNCREHGISIFDDSHPEQGIVHVIGPELGLTQPGMTIACGDSHTSTHGAFGSIAFGIGTSQVRDVLATQTMAAKRLHVRRIEVSGSLRPGVYAKDLILHIIRSLGVQGGLGYAYEYAGPTIEAMSMEERMTICNMSIEGGARIGYVNPDRVTFDYLRDKPYAPKGENWDRALEYWSSIASDPDASYDDVVRFAAESIEPTVTWGITPGQAVGINENLPQAAEAYGDAFGYMKLSPGQPIKGIPIDVAFIGSCTNARLSDLREVASFVRGHRVSEGLQALVVPGSGAVKAAAEAEGLDEVFREAGFQWREPGCSMCLAMNPDKLQGDQVCASSSNRNFKGRQGSPQGRTLLMSPVMVAACAIAGEVADAREVFGVQEVRVP